MAFQRPIAKATSVLDRIQQESFPAGFSRPQEKSKRPNTAKSPRKSPTADTLAARVPGAWVGENTLPDFREPSVLERDRREISFNRPKFRDIRDPWPPGTLTLKRPIYETSPVTGKRRIDRYEDFTVGEPMKMWISENNPRKMVMYPPGDPRADQSYYIGHEYHHVPRVHIPTYLDVVAEKFRPAKEQLDSYLDSGLQTLDYLGDVWQTPGETEYQIHLARFAVERSIAIKLIHTTWYVKRKGRDISHTISRNWRSFARRRSQQAMNCFRNGYHSTERRMTWAATEVANGYQFVGQEAERRVTQATTRIANGYNFVGRQGPIHLETVNRYVQTTVGSTKRRLIETTNSMIPQSLSDISVWRRQQNSRQSLGPGVVDTAEIHRFALTPSQESQARREFEMRIDDATDLSSPHQGFTDVTYGPGAPSIQRSDPGPSIGEFNVSKLVPPHSSGRHGSSVRKTRSKNSMHTIAGGASDHHKDDQSQGNDDVNEQVTEDEDMDDAPKLLVEDDDESMEDEESVEDDEPSSEDVNESDDEDEDTEENDDQEMDDADENDGYEDGDISEHEIEDAEAEDEDEESQGDSMHGGGHSEAYSEDQSEADDQDEDSIDPEGKASQAADTEDSDSASDTDLPDDDDNDDDEDEDDNSDLDSLIKKALVGNDTPLKERSPKEGTEGMNEDNKLDAKRASTEGGPAKQATQETKEKLDVVGKGKSTKDESPTKQATENISRLSLQDEGEQVSQPLHYSNKWWNRRDAQSGAKVEQTLMTNSSPETQRFNTAGSRISTRTTRRKVAEEEARKAEEARLAKIREEEEKRRRLYRKKPGASLFPPPSDELVAKVDAALRCNPNKEIAKNIRGSGITRAVFSRLLPQAGDFNGGWLNDEIVNASVEQTVARALEQSGYDSHRRHKPRIHAFNSFFYAKLDKDGASKVLPWSRRAKIGGKDLLDVETIIIPINEGNAHWTLMVVSPAQRTVEYFDSFHTGGQQHYAKIRSWLEAELKEDFDANEWSFRPGLGPRQRNGKDCGVFVASTAKCVALGWDPEFSYSASDMEAQRYRIAAELIHPDSLKGELEPPVAEGRLAKLWAESEPPPAKKGKN